MVVRVLFFVFILLASYPLNALPDDWHSGSSSRAPRAPERAELLPTRENNTALNCCSRLHWGLAHWFCGIPEYVATIFCFYDANQNGRYENSMCGRKYRTDCKLKGMTAAIDGCPCSEGSDTSECNVRLGFCCEAVCCLPCCLTAHLCMLPSVCCDRTPQYTFGLDFSQISANTRDFKTRSQKYGSTGKRSTPSRSSSERERARRENEHRAASQWAAEQERARRDAEHEARVRAEQDRAARNRQEEQNWYRRNR